MYVNVRTWSPKSSRDPFLPSFREHRAKLVTLSISATFPSYNTPPVGSVLHQTRSYWRLNMTDIWIRIAGLAGAAGESKTSRAHISLHFVNCELLYILLVAISRSSTIIQDFFFKRSRQTSLLFAAWDCFLILFMLMIGVSMGAIGAHAITKSSNEMKETMKVWSANYFSSSTISSSNI